MVLCPTWSETLDAQPQLTQFWPISRHRKVSYPLSMPCFVINVLQLWNLLVHVHHGTYPAPPKKIGEIVYLSICSFLLCLSSLLCCQVRKFRRDLGITLYKYKHYLYIFAVSKMAASVNVRSCWVADTVEVDAWLIKYSDVRFCSDGAWNTKICI